MAAPIRNRAVNQGDLFDPIDGDVVIAEHSASAVAPPPSQLVAASLDRWQRAPELAFRAWKEGQRTHGKEFAPHSVEQYETMFRAYLRWLTDRGIDLASAKAEHLDLFLMSKSGRDGKPAASTTRRRYLLLLNHVYEHLRLIELRHDNPAAPLIDLTRNQDFEKPAPTILPFELADRYIAWTLAQPEEAWNDLRDKALRLIFIGAGITVGEAQGLGPTSCVTDAGFTALNIPAHGFVLARMAPVSDLVAPALLAWKKRLARMAPHSEHLFPARLFAIGHDRPDVTAVASAEVFLIVQEAMNAIGYERPRQGPQTLRNTFIARQLWDGKPIDRIMAWCGLQTPETVQRIGKMVPVRRDGVAPG